jgi:uncharacterized membrane protein
MTSSQNGSSQAEQWENLQRRDEEQGGVNVGRTERLISGAAAVALGVLGVRQKRLRPLVLPLVGGLLSRAVSGRCAINRALGRNTARGDRVSPVASVARGQGTKLEQTVKINRPVSEVYQFWRNFENLPRFMDHLESVTVIDEDRSHWVAKAPAGAKVEWDATIHNEIEDELIAWRSLPGSEINNAGSVHFTPDEQGTATFVTVVLSYEPPAGKLGTAVAKLFGEEPSTQVADDLRRLKQVMEAAEPAGTSNLGVGRP